MVQLLFLLALSQDPHLHPQPNRPPDSPEPHAESHGRDASGTAWQPESTPVRAYHRTAGSWMLMGHGLVFAGYDHQGSERGSSAWTAPNWFMGMARRQSGAWRWTGRVMLSLDPVTVRKKGYPLLLQTGESVDGRPLHDRQHPHDLFMETAAQVTRRWGASGGVEGYAAASGEPALGPVAFPHRNSSEADPLAPLGHHWQDSSHISFGVLTAGLFTRRWKLEGSWFNGREPDEERYDFDFHALDSYSGRLWWMPDSSWALQVSYGYLDRPEELEPEVSIHRITASAAWNRRVPRGNWSALAVWGRNHTSGGDTDAILVEAHRETDRGHHLFGRAEYAEKTGEDLVIPGPEDATFEVVSLAGGYLVEFRRSGWVAAGAGIRASLQFLSDELEPFYGTKRPAGFMAYLRFTPGKPAAGAAPPSGHLH